MPSATTFPDWLEDGLEPTGAVQTEQDTCTWTRDNLRNHNTTCGETWPAFIGLPADGESCPWCARQIARAEQ